VREANGRRAEPRAPVEAALVGLVPLAAAGDKAAFTRLVETFHADMARLAYFVCGGNRELAEDAVQSAWAIAWSRLGTLRDAERIRPWLLSVTANEARQILRRQRQGAAVRLEFAEERVGALDAFPSPASIDMATILARLKPEERTLIACDMPRA
jgi:RNA polymerase sigma-70 factor (ECF subfamily)